MIHVSIPRSAKTRSKKNKNGKTMYNANIWNFYLKNTNGDASEIK